MSQRRNIIVLSSDGATDATSLYFGLVSVGGESEVITVRVFNAELTGSISQNRLHCIRADFLRSGGPSEDPLDARRAGGEPVAEAWLMARKVGDEAWQVLDEESNHLDLGEIAAQAHVLVEIKLSVPSGADTFGDVDFALVVRSR